MSIGIWVPVVVALCSVGIGAVYSVRFAPDRESRYQSAILSIVLALVSVDFGLIFAHHDEAEMLRGIRRDVGVYPRLIDDTDRQFVEGFLSTRVQIETHKNTFLTRQSERVMNGFLSRLHDLATGVISIEGKDIRMVAQQLMTEATKSAWATSVFTEGWSEVWGEEYWSLQRRLLASGVRIQRVFFVHEEEPKEALIRLFTEQAEAGVEVFSIDMSKRHEVEEEDMLIIDNALAATLSLSPTGGVAGGLVYADPARVQDWCARFESLRSSGERFKIPE